MFPLEEEVIVACNQKQRVLSYLAVYSSYNKKLLIILFRYIGMSFFVNYNNRSERKILIRENQNQYPFEGIFSERYTATKCETTNDAIDSRKSFVRFIY